MVMLEDALKNIRNIHRLLLTVSFITIIFSLSISFPEDKVQQLSTLKLLSDVPFMAYDQFTEKKVKAFEEKELLNVANKLNKKLESKGYILLNIHHIGEALSKNIHTGKILTNELFLKDINSATINQFEALNGLSIHNDIQVLLPQVDELIEKLTLYFDESAGIGRRVDSVNITIGDFNFIAETFLPGEETFINIYFELPYTLNRTGAPVFTADFPAKIQTIPNSSFVDWLNIQPEAKALYLEKNKQLEWLTDLPNLPSGFHEQKIGLLKKQLEDEIKKSSPEQQKISVLGANIPGVLFIYASPLLMLALTYYLMNSSFHLLRMSKIDDNKEFFKQFSWPPLSLVIAWRWEAIFSLIVMPYLALTILLFQLARFGFSTVSSISVVVIAGGMLLIPNKFILQNLVNIRANISKPVTKTIISTSD